MWRVLGGDGGGDEGGGLRGTPKAPGRFKPPATASSPNLSLQNPFYICFSEES